MINLNLPSEPSKEKDAKKKLTKMQYFLRELRALVLIVVLVFAFRSTFYEPFRIPSGSMIPTLMIGDFILVNKFAYGLRIPFSDTWGGNSIYIGGESNPQRGDVVVFKYPKNTDIFYIKRVIGVPGDELELIDKVLYVNGVPHVREQIDGTSIMQDMDEKFSLYDFNFYKENIGEARPVIQELTSLTRNSNFEKITVPQGHYFMMGDNRDFSEDSRAWGFVPQKLIRGKAIGVWLSMIFPFGDEEFKFRYWRIGKGIN